MSTEFKESTSSEPADDKAARIARVMNDVFAARASGKLVDYESLMQNNADLMPDLADALKGFERVKSARAVAEAAPTITPEMERLAAAVRDEFERPLIQAPGYSIEGELARGGQSIIYLATQLSTGRRVVVKVLRDGPLADERALARFKREAQILAALNHPNIVTVLDAGRTAEGSRFIVMDYIGGRTLDEFLQDRQRKYPDDPSKLLRLFLKMCAAVSAAHLRGVVHRDLKPSNIRIDDRGEPHILDFGLARTALDRFNESIAQPVSITGEFLGSLPWSSPEQAEGDSDKIDLRTDVYSLGVMLYQMLTGGQFPYAVVGNIRDVLNNILTAEPVPPSRVLKARDAVAGNDPRDREIHTPLINETMERIVLKTLAKRPDDRYQSASELGRAIADYLAGRSPAPALPINDSLDLVPSRKSQNLSEETDPAAARERAPYLAMATAAVLLLLAIVAIFSRNRSNRIASGQPESVNESTTPAQPGPPTVNASSVIPRRVDLMPLADLDQNHKNWQRQGDTLVGTSQALIHLGFSYQPPAEYDYHIRVVRKSGREGMNFSCVAGTKHFHLNIRLLDNLSTQCEFQRLPNTNPVILNSEPVPNQKLDVVIKIRKDSAEAVVNGVAIITRTTDFSEVPTVRNPQDVLGLAAFKLGDGALTIEAADVVEISGAGNILHPH